MAWCTECSQDRPIERRVYEGDCPICGVPNEADHTDGCLAPVPGALDICQFCNEPVYRLAKSAEAYAELAARRTAARLERTAEDSLCVQRRETAVRSSCARRWRSDAPSAGCSASWSDSSPSSSAGRSRTTAWT